LVGDLHGDLEVSRRALVLAGAVDAKGKWSGGNLVLVLVGDLLDRGSQERALLDWVLELKATAPADGGRVVVLNGNHEAMNVAGDLRYVTTPGLAEFQDFAQGGVPQALRGAAPAEAHGRLIAFLPGGPYARKLAEHPAVALVGDTLVAHAGVLPEHVRYGLERFNRELAAWMRAESAPTLATTSDQSPLWTRELGQRKVKERECERVGEVLSAVKATRLVVGHSVQDQGIEPACQQRLWRIDVGLSKFYGGPLEVLEVSQGKPRVLSDKSEKL
jgi:hypothetical protein